jgi:PKD repeat protein
VTPDPDLLDPASKHLVWGTNQLIGTPVVDDPRWTTRNFALQANATPVASFTASPNPAFTGQVINLDASASSGAITEYEWDFDGDGTFDSTGAVTSHTYSQAGTFAVQLRVTEAGATDTTTRSLTINSSAPTAAFTAAPTVVIRGQSVSFDGSASTDAEAPGGIESYRWDFDGDGVTDQTTAGPVVTHAYTALGTFNVRLAVTDADDHQASPTVTRQITVQNVAPMAQIAFSPAAPETGQPVSFSAAGASDSDGTIVDYRWDLDGDGVFETDTGAQPQATRSYSTPGTFAVTVRVQDNDGATATAGSSARVVAAPVALAVTPPATAASLKLALKLSRTARLATLLKRGLAASVNCGRSCTVRLTLRISSKVGKQLKTPRVIGTSSIVVKSSGAKTVRVRLTRRARKQLLSARSFVITVTGTATDSARHSASAKVTVRVRR